MEACCFLEDRDTEVKSRQFSWERRGANWDICSGSHENSAFLSTKLVETVGQGAHDEECKTEILLQEHGRTQCSCSAVVNSTRDATGVQKRGSE